MIYCPSCGIANRDGSRFCNECGAKLPTATSVRCPQCGTPNPPNSMFCEKCSTRLVAPLAPEEPDEPEPLPIKKGLSLPSKLTPSEPASTPSGDDMPDWMSDLRADSSAESAESEGLPDWLAQLATASGTTPDTTAEPAAATQPSDEEVPAWLSGLTAPEPPTRSTPVAPPAEVTPPAASAEETPDWLNNLRASTSEDVPDWLNQLSAAPEQPETPGDPDVPEWLRQLGVSADIPEVEPSATPALPSGLDWSGTLREAAAETDAPLSDEVPDWLSGLGLNVAEPEAQVPAAANPIEPAAPDIPAAPEATPKIETDWLGQLRAAAPLSTDELVPAEDTTEPQPDMAFPEPAADDVPDWLSALGATAPAAVAASAFDQPDKPETDWLGQLRSGAEGPAADEAEPDWLGELGVSTPAKAAEDVPDWLSQLQTEPADPQTEAAQATNEVSADWLSELRATVPDESVEPAAAETASSGDWLSELRAATPAESVESAAAETALPGDWLSELRAATPAESVESAAAETALPGDWLSELRATTSAESAELNEPADAAPAAEESSDDVPAWLLGLGTVGAVGAAAALSADEPEPVAPRPQTDWLGQLRAAAPMLDEESTEEEPLPPAELPQWLSGESAAAPSADLPQWLSSEELGAPSDDLPVLPVSAEEPPVEQEVPDWLRDLGVVSGTVTSAKIASDVPDWLADAPPAEAAVGPVGAAAAATDEDVPDWLRAVEPAATLEAEPSVPETAAESDEGLPDWLKAVGVVGAVGAAGVAGAAALGAKALSGSDEGPEWGTIEPEATAEPAELPSWLAGLTPADTGTSGPAKPIEETPEPETAKPVSPAIAAVAGLGAVTIAATRVGEPQPAVPAELPDWLKTLREGKPVLPDESVLQVPGLTQAEIPSWVEALRPKEGEAETITPLDLGDVEAEGIFAGLPQVLPSAPVMGRVQGQPARLARETTAEDLARAGVLQELLARGPSAPKPVPAALGRTDKAQRRTMQWVVLALLLAVILPWGGNLSLNKVVGFDLLPRIGALPVRPATQLAAGHIATLPAQTNVLVVFDYDAAQAGEMNQVAEVVVRHLLARQANITAASLNPIGAGLAQAVWNDIEPELRGRGQWQNMGYVSGQAMGAHNLLNMRGAAELVIDLTASPETLRWWVEQRELSSNQAALIAGSSAAVEPLALPYVQSGQLRGLISGSLGADIYAQQANLLPQLDQTEMQVHLEAQTLAQWLLAIVIVVAMAGTLVRGAGRRTS